jgi:hypothetical protein
MATIQYRWLQGEYAHPSWRRREENPWLHEAELRVKKIVPVVLHEETDQVLKETFAPLARPDGIWAPSSTWFITATGPGCSDVRPQHLQRAAPGFRHKRR